MNVASQPAKPHAKDYASDQEVRWCPGCGDYAILKALQRTFAELEVKTEDTTQVMSASSCRWRVAPRVR